MAGTVNKVILIGNLGQNPEVREMKNGGRMARFSIATSERWTDKNGERQERTEWHRVVVMTDKLAELCGKYLAKGSKVYVEGKLQTRKYQDESGENRYSTEVVLSGFDGRMTMLTPKGEGGSAPAQQKTPAQELDENEIDF